MGILESIGKRLAVRFGCLLLVGAIVGTFGGLGGGIVMLISSTQKPDELVTLSTKECYAKQPESSYVHLTHGELRLLQAIWIENQGTIKEVYVPLYPKDAEKVKPMLFLKTTNPNFLELARKSNSGDMKDQLKALVEYKDLGDPRDFQGMTYPSYMIDDTALPELQKMNPGKEILMFVEGDTPMEQGEMAGAGAVFIAIGVISLLVLIAVAFGLFKLFSGPKTPPDAPLQNSSGPPPIPTA